jgi:hypothetical protein
MDYNRNGSELPVITATYNLARPHHSFYDRITSKTERVNSQEQNSKKGKRHKTVINVVGEDLKGVSNSYAMQSETGQRTLTGSNEYMRG